jgi:hypothetical protein
MPHQPVRFAFTALLLFIIVIIITELFGVFYSIKGCAPYGKFKLGTSHQQQEEEFKYEMFP